MAKLREEKAKDQDEINRLRDGVAFKERECQDNDAKIKSVDYDLYKAQEKANELSKLADAKDFELRRTHEALENAQAELMRAKDDHSRLMVEAQSLQRNLDGQLTEKSDLQRQAEGEDARNRDLTSQVFERENRLRNTDDQFVVSRKEQDNLRFSNQNMMERNGDLKAEIDAVQSHCNVLGGQNKDLNVELERFVQTDEQIRATLNRRDRVQDLRTKTQDEIHRSAIDVERASPVRRRG